jgi:hypothetical protein
MHVGFPLSHFCGSQVFIMAAAESGAADKSEVNFTCICELSSNPFKLVGRPKGVLKPKNPAEALTERSSSAIVQEQEDQGQTSPSLAQLAVMQQMPGDTYQFEMIASSAAAAPTSSAAPAVPAAAPQTAPLMTAASLLLTANESSTAPTSTSSSFDKRVVSVNGTIHPEQPFAKRIKKETAQVECNAFDALSVLAGVSATSAPR